MKRKSLLLLLILVAAASLFGFSACDDNKQPVTYQVTFDYNYENAPAAKVLTVKEGDKPAVPAFTRTNYAFKGWTSDRAGLVSADPNAAVTAAAAYYAKWEILEYSITLKFNYTGAPADTVVKYDADKLPSISNPTREDHDFVKWTTDAAGSTAYDPAAVTNGMSLYAQWKIHTYKITFDRNFTTQQADTEIDVDLDKKPAAGQVPVYTRENYKFAGWSTLADGSDEFDPLTGTYSGDKTLYAKWEHKVTHISLMDGDDELGSFDVNAGDPIAVIYEDDVFVYVRWKDRTGAIVDFSDLKAPDRDNAEIVYTADLDSRYTKGIAFVKVDGSDPYYSASAVKSALPAGVTAVWFPKIYDGLEVKLISKGDSLSGIESVMIPSSVETVEKGVFYNATTLKSVTFGENSKLKKLGTAVTNLSSGKAAAPAEGVFANCTALTDLDLGGAELSELGDCTFFGCSSLKGMTLDVAASGKVGGRAFNRAFSSTASVIVNLGAGATTWHVPFAGIACKNLNIAGLISIPSASGYTNTSWNLDGTSTLMAMLAKGYPAFANCVNLETVAFDQALTEIGDGAFAKTDVKSVMIANSEVTFGKGLFYNASMSSFIFNANFNKIGESMFENCKNLESLTGTEHILSVGSDAFKGAKLTEFVWKNGILSFSPYALRGSSVELVVNLDSDINPTYFELVKTGDKKDFLLSKGETVEIIYDFGISAANSVRTIPEGVTNINGIYQGDVNLTKIVIPASVKTISEDAFANCTKLAEVRFASGSLIETIGSGAFSGAAMLSLINLEACTQLKTIPDNFMIGTAIASVTINPLVTSIGLNAFKNCKQLQSVSFNANVKTIGSYAFDGCDKLSTVDQLPSALQTIGSYAFQNCVVLTNFPVIPASVTKIDYYAFKGCTLLDEIAFGENSALTEIGNFCFQNTALISIVLPGGLKTLGTDVFLGTKLASVNLGDTKITSVGANAFLGTKISTVTIPGTVTSIGNNAFKDCAELSSVTFAAGTANLTFGANAFENCAKLTSFTIPGRTAGTSSYALGLGNLLFKNCSALSTVEFEAGTVGLYIGTAFFGTPIESIVIPDRTVQIASGAFANCAKLRDITLPFVGYKTAASASSSSLLGYIFGTAAYEGGVATKQYYSASGNSTYYIPAALKNVTVTKDKVFYGAFSNCTGLESVTLPATLTEIPASIFSGCTNLKVVTCAADKVLTLGADAFKDVAAAVMKVPSEKLAEYQADEDWKKLTNVTLEALLADIPDTEF